jgi:hypothetical protein
VCRDFLIWIRVAKPATDEHRKDVPGALLENGPQKTRYGMMLSTFFETLDKAFRVGRLKDH